MKPSISTTSLTYTLGRSLYVPLTSRCNSRTLPATRGPNFLLPSEVVSTLCRFRDAEHDTQQWHHWCNYLDSTEYPQKLPDPFDSVIRFEKDAERTPPVTAIHEAITAQLLQRDYDEIVIAGEGEPTLRWDDLLYISSVFSKQHTIRVTTNGLLQPADDKVSALKQHGVNVVSVALMTADPTQYTMLMSPRTEELTRAPHDIVCDFVQEAVLQEMDVEITAVDRSEVNKQQVEALALSLGVSAKVRWRTYFP